MFDTHIFCRIFHALVLCTVILCLGACNTQDSTGGQARCGADAHCPDGYVCQDKKCVPGFFSSGPGLDIVSPEQGSLVGGILSVAVQVEDPTDVQTDTVSASIGHFEVSLAGDESGSYTANINTSDLTQTSEQTLVVKALDHDGNTGIARADFSLDLTGPDIIVAVPTIESETAFTFTTYITDASGVDSTSVQATLDDSESFALSESGSGLYTAYVDISSLSESGVYTLTISASDLYGNVNTATRVVDLVGPTIEITDPAAGSLVGGNISISATITDNSGIDDTSVSAAIGDLSGFTLSTAGDNVYTGTFSETDSLGGVEAQSLSVSATDVYGNTKTQSVALTIDFVAPVITWIEPLESTVITDETFVLAATITDNASIATITLDVGDLSDVTMELTSDDRYEVTLTTEEVSLEGVVAAIITATDIYGNVGELSQNISIDRSGPTLTLNNPTSGEYIGPQFQINVDAADLSGVASVVATIDSSLEYTLVRQGTSDTFVIDFETQHLTSTDVIDWQVLATDTLGNQTLLSSTFIEDLIKPVIALTSPVSSLVGGSIILSATFEDNVAINTSTIEGSLSTADNVYPLTLELYTGSEYRTTFDITSEFAVHNDLADEMVLTLTVKDLSDSDELTVANSTTVYYQLNIDKEAPVIVINAPAMDEVVTGTFSIVVAVSDNSDQIASVIATIDYVENEAVVSEGPIALIDYGSTYEATYNANEIVNAVDPELKITATDIYGNVSTCCSETPHIILVNGSGPAITINAPTSETATVTSDLAIEAQVVDDLEEKGLLMLCTEVINGPDNCYNHASGGTAPANCTEQCELDSECTGTCDALVMGFVTATGAACTGDGDCSGIETCNSSSVCESTIQTQLTLKSGEEDVFEGTLASTDFADLNSSGEQTLIIKAYDADYNPSNATQTFSIDSVAPTVSVVVPEINTHVSPSAVNVVVTATDLQGVCSLTAQMDSGALVDLWQHGEKGCSSLPGNIADCSGYAPEATNSNYFCRQVNISTVASPPNVLTIKAVDAFNNESILSWPVTVDVTGPVITLDSLDISTSGDNAGELTIQSTLVDEGHSVSSANFVI
ncbi:MAG: Ig-like domain-containing protein, partial [Myxococcota bacterium]|nr:Ig-like domain-containing protein [Myxococcota bacterium]